MIDDELITKFMDNFLGYGDLNSDVWFIGMEEGGGNDITDIEKRLSAWKELGQDKTVDLEKFHQLIGEGRLFDGDKPKLQRTWAKLIRAQISFERDPNDTSSIEKPCVKEFQSKRLGRKKSKTCLLELFPLPSPRTTIWHYSDYSHLSLLQSRDEYKKKKAPIRIELLRKEIRDYSPSHVVFYGTSYAKYWSEIIGEELKWVDKTRSVNRIGAQTFYVISHPTRPGVNNSMFESLLLS